MGTASRVLPWRRQNTTIAEELSPLLTAYKSRHPKGSVSQINSAYEMARSAHASQNRSSGELYINHPIAVARIVADLGLDETSIVAALLHDAVEDTEITLADVESNFGIEVATIVDGVTKLERLHFDSKEAQQAATMRKMLVAMARDLRVLMIKLADRLHNMRTIAAVPHEKQQRIAQESLDIYAPLAHRLGMQEIKQQLEDLAFAACFWRNNKLKPILRRLIDFALRNQNLARVARSEFVFKWHKSTVNSCTHTTMTDFSVYCVGKINRSRKYRKRYYSTLRCEHKKLILFKIRL